MNVLARYLVVLFFLSLWGWTAGCTKKDSAEPETKGAEAPAKTADAPEAKPAETGSDATKQVDKPEEPPAARLGKEVLTATRDRLKKCVGDHLEQLELDQYRTGNLTLDMNAMDRACKTVFSELADTSSGLLFVHETLDKALFNAALTKDGYQRVKLYALRVGSDSKKNTKKLKSHWLATRRAAKVFSSSVKRWLAAEGVPDDATKPDRTLVVAFLKGFSENFQTYLSKPVKGKKAIYYGVTDYLKNGLGRMNDPAAGLGPEARSRLTELIAIFDEARAFYKEFDRAAKSKKDYAKKVRGAVKKLSSAIAAGR